MVTMVSKKIAVNTLAKATSQPWIEDIDRL